MNESALNYAESLLALLPQSVSASMQRKPAAAIAMVVFDKYITYESSVVDLKTAVHLYHLTLSLKRHSFVSTEKKTLEKQEHETRTLKFLFFELP